MHPHYEEIITHLRFYGLTTEEALARLFFENSEAEANAFVETMLSTGVFSVHLLYKGKNFYQLADARKNLSGDLLKRAYGVLSFCCLDTIQRQLLAPGELRETFGFYDPAPSVRYYLEGVKWEQRTLGFLLVDTGSDYRRMVRRIREHVEKRLAIPALQELHTHNLLDCSIVTYAPERKSIFRAALHQRPLVLNPKIFVLPELSFLSE